MSSSASADQPPTIPGQPAILDTSVLIAVETGRPIRLEALPSQAVITVITLAELEAGVLAASDAETRGRRLRTLTALGGTEVLPVDAAAASAWARLRVHLADAGRRMNVNDLWIAAIAVSRGLPILTQDRDFEALDGYPGITVIQL